MPVKIILISLAFAALMTSSSYFDPPGVMTVLIPASATA
jgi:hypothetical protein